MMSHDFEDIVTVIDGRTNILNEAADFPGEISAYFKDEFKKLLQIPYINDVISGFLEPGLGNKVRLNRIQSFLTSFQ